MEEQERNECAYCVHHAWHDPLEYHICLLEETMDERKCGETCKKFKDSYICRGH